MKSFLPRYGLVFWLLLGLAQIAVPASLVWRSERIQKLGTEYRFLLAPVDPADPFKGRFLALSFEIEQNGITAPAGADDAEALYLALGVDERGFAKATGLTLAPPASGDYLKLAKGQWWTTFRDSTKLEPRLPFKRYYVNENRAPEIEKEANRLARQRRESQTPLDVYAVVRVADGEGALLSLQGPNGELK